MEKKIGSALFFLMLVSACGASKPDSGFLSVSVAEKQPQFILTSATTDLVSFDITVGVVGGSARVCMAYTAGSETQRLGSRSVGKVSLVSQGMSDTRHPLLPDDSGDEYAKTICWDNISTGKYTVQIESGSLDDITAAFKTEPVSIQPQALLVYAGDLESTTPLLGGLLPVVAAYPNVRPAKSDNECSQLVTSLYGTQSIPSRFVFEIVTAQNDLSTNVVLKRLETNWYARGGVEAVTNINYSNIVQYKPGSSEALEWGWKSSSVTRANGDIMGTAVTGDISRMLVMGQPLCFGTAFHTIALGMGSWCMRNDLRQLVWADSRTGVAYRLNAGDNPIIGHELCRYNK